MKIATHNINNAKIAEVSSNDFLITKAEDGLDLLGNVYYQGFDGMVIYEKNIGPEFFDLKTGMAGEILQKFSTYRVRLAIVGEFSKYPGNSLKDFIRESNRGRQVNFVGSAEEAFQLLSEE